MISVTGVTGKYSIQPTTLDMHHQSLEWISAAALWKLELTFFRKLLDLNTTRESKPDIQKKVDNYQHQIAFYDDQVDTVKEKVMEHENKLAHALQDLNESDTEYFSGHDGLMDELKSFEKTYRDFKHEYITFIEKRIGAYYL